MSEPYSMSEEQIINEIYNLTNEQAGNLFKGMLKYVQDKGYAYGGYPVFGDKVLNDLWPFVEYRLLQDMYSYREIF